MIPVPAFLFPAGLGAAPGLASGCTLRAVADFLLPLVSAPRVFSLNGSVRGSTAADPSRRAGLSPGAAASVSATTQLPMQRPLTNEVHHGQ